MARDFTAASSHTVNYGDIGDLGVNKITLACWMYPDSFATSYGLINKRSAHNSANAYSMGVGYTSANRWELQLGNAANTAVGANYYATRSEATSQWYHVCMTYDGSLSAGSRCAIYINASSKAVTASTDANVTPGNAASDLVLGRVNNTGSFYFDGRMAEAAVWDVALSADEVAALADCAAPILVRPANLAFYAPLVRSLHDVMSGTVGTSSSAVIEHPPMRYPGRGHVVVPAVGGANEGSGTVSGTGTLEGTGYNVHSGDGDVTATGTLAGTGYNLHYGNGSVSGTGALAGEGYAPTGTSEGAGTVSGAGTFVGVGYALSSGTGDVTGEGVLVGAGGVQQSVTEQPSGGWLSLPDYTRGREEYIRLQRIAMGITQEQQAPATVIPETVTQTAKVVALRQRGVRMDAQRREAELRAEVERTQAWKDDYASALYAELYRIEKQRREDDLIVALLAA